MSKVNNFFETLFHAGFVMLVLILVGSLIYDWVVPDKKPEPAEVAMEVKEVHGCLYVYLLIIYNDNISVGLEHLASCPNHAEGDTVVAQSLQNLENTLQRNSEATQSWLEKFYENYYRTSSGP